MFVKFSGLFEDEPEYEYVDYSSQENNEIKPVDNNYKLKLEYNDPFLGKISRSKTTNSLNSTTISNAPKTLKPESKKILPKVVYKGLVKNKKSDSKTGLLVINGKSYLISRNKEYDDVKVISFNETKCDYEFGGVIYSDEK